MSPGKVFKHTVYTLNFSCPLKMPLNQIKIALLSKSRINFIEFPGWKVTFICGFICFLRNLIHHFSKFCCRYSRIPLGAHFITQIAFQFSFFFFILGFIYSIPFSFSELTCPHLFLWILSPKSVFWYRISYLTWL